MGWISQCLRAERRLIVREVEGCTDAGLGYTQIAFFVEFKPLKSRWLQRGICSAKRPELQHKIHQLPHHPHAYDLSQADAEPSSAAKRRRGRAGPFIARRI